MNKVPSSVWLVLFLFACVLMVFSSLWFVFLAVPLALLWVFAPTSGTKATSGKDVQ